MSKRKVHVPVFSDVAACLQSHQRRANEVAHTVFLDEMLALFGFLEMVCHHPEHGLQFSLEHIQCWQSCRVAVAKVGVIDQADRLRVLMNFIAFLEERKIFPLFVRQIQDKIFKFRDVDIADMKEVSWKIHAGNSLTESIWWLP